MSVVLALDVKPTSLTTDEIAEAKKKADIDRKSQLMIREIAWQVVFLVLILWVVVGSQDSNVFHQNQHLRNLFVEEMPTVKLRPFYCCNYEILFQGQEYVSPGYASR